MRKFMVMVLMALFALSLSGAALAQDVPVICGDLSDADCALLTDAQTNMLEVSSGNLDLSLSVTLAGLGTPEPITVVASGMGAFSGDLSAFYTQSVSPTDLMLDASRYSDYLQSIFSGFNGQLDLTLELPADVLQGMAGEAVEEVPESLTLNLLLVDGIGYLDFAPLRELAGEEAIGTDLPEGWGGIDIAGALGMSVEQALGMGGGLGEMADEETLAQLSDPEFVSQYAEVTRIEDGVAADGSATARFQTTIDYVGLMSSDPMREIMAGAMGGAEMSEEQLDQMTGMLSQMYEGLDLVSTTSVGLEDGLMRGQEVTFDWDLSMLLGMAGGGEAGAAPVLNMVFAYELSNFNSGAEITAPEGAPVVSAEELMGMGAME